MKVVDIDAVVRPKKKILVIADGVGALGAKPDNILNTFPCVIDYLVPNDHALDLLRNYPPLRKLVPSLDNCELSFEDPGRYSFDAAEAVYITNACCGNKIWHDHLSDPNWPPGP